MPVRSAQLGYARTTTANVAVNLITCGSGQTIIVKSVTIVARQVGPATVFIRLDPTGATTVTAVHVVKAMAQNDTNYFDCWIVLEPGDSLDCLCDVANGAGVFASGAILDGVA